MQKAPAQMNPELDSALGDIGGKTGLRIIRAIVAGERDGARLAKLRAFSVDLTAAPSIGAEAMPAIFSEAGSDFSMLTGESKFCQRPRPAQGRPRSEEPARQAEVRQLFRQAKRLGLDVLDKDGDIVQLEQALA